MLGNRVLNMLLAIVMFFGGLISCQQSSTDWCLHEGKGLKKKDESFKAMLFIDEQVGFLLGHELEVKRDHDGNLTGAKTAIIYKTEDGGRNWHRKSFGIGSFKEITKDGVNLYISKIIENEDDFSVKSMIYRSINKGESWEKIIEFPIMIGHIVFSEKGTGLLLKHDESRKIKAYLSHNSGESWEKQENEFPIYGTPILKEDYMWYYTALDSTNPTLSNTLVKFNFLKGKSTVVEQLPKGFNIYNMLDHNDALWFIGRENDGVNLYKRLEGGNYQLINRFESEARVFPKKLHVVGKEVFVVIGERKDGYIENHSFRSVDEGQTWSEEIFADPLYVKPMCFYDKPDQGTFLTWIYSGSGEVQIPCKQRINK